MKRLTPVASWALVGLLILGQALFVAAYITHEHTFYFWDHAMYFSMARQAHELFGQDVAAGWAALHQSMSDNYNLLFALPSLFSFTLFDSSRLVFILTNFAVFFLTYELAIAFLLRRWLKLDRPFALVLSLATSALIPPLWLPLLEGYPDVGAAACLVFAAALALDGPGQQKIIRRGLSLGLILGLAVLLRRHFVYATIALLATLACFSGYGIAATKKDRWRQLGRAVLYFIACGIGFVGLLGVIAPDFLYDALTTNYGALYFSYQRPPLVFLQFVLSGFGFILLLASTIGLILLARTNSSGQRLASFVALYTVLWLIIWCAGPDQMGHHYMLHALPLFVSVGLVGWVVYLADRHKYILGIALAVFLTANSAWALWFSPTGVWPNDNGWPGFLSAPRPPVIRSDYNEWLKLANYLRETTGPDDRIMMIGSSFVFNQDLLRSIYTDLLGRPGMFYRFVRAPEIDHEEPAPLNAFAAANIYLVPVPPQYHLDPAGQRVIGAAAAQFPPPPERVSLFHKDKTVFSLTDGVTVEIWRRDLWKPAVLHEALQEIRRDGPKDTAFAQSWVATTMPLQARIHTDSQNSSMVDGLFLPGLHDMRLFFDQPLTGGRYNLVLALQGNCPAPQLEMKIRQDEGHTEVLEELAVDYTGNTILRSFAVPDKEGKNYYLELDLAVSPATLCQMELRQLQVKKER